MEKIEKWKNDGKMEKQWKNDEKKARFIEKFLKTGLYWPRHGQAGLSQYRNFAIDKIRINKFLKFYNNPNF